MAPAVVDALVVDTLLKVVLGHGVLDIGQLAGSGQVAAVGCSGRNGASVHQRHSADLTLAGLRALAVGEIAGRVADREFAVGGGIARAEAGAAEALAEDAACRDNIGHCAVFDQLQIGRHTVGVDAELKLAVAAAFTADNIRDRADIFIGAAGAAGHNALIHIDAAIVADLADQVHLDLAAQLLIGLILSSLQNLFRVGFQFADRVSVAGVHRQGDHALNGGQIQLNAAIIVGHIGGLQFPIGLGAVVLLEVLFRNIVSLPDGGPAGRLGGHDINAVAVVGGKIGNAGADKLHDPVLHIAVGVGGGHEGKSDIVGADTGVGLAGQIDGDHARVGHIVGAADQLLGQLAAALADGHRAEGAVAGVGVRAEDHPAAAGHHFPVIAVDDRHVRRDIDAAVLVRGGQGKLVVVLVDGAAHGAETVVAVRHDIGQRKFLHAGGARRLDDADIGNVMARHRVEFHAQILHGIACVMGLEDAVGDSAFFGFGLGHTRRSRGLGDAVYKINAMVVQFHGRTLRIICIAKAFPPWGKVARSAG